MRAPAPAPPLTGILLAGGGSHRMGRDKRLLEVGGEPLAASVLRKLRAVCRRVLVSVSDPADAALFPGSETVPDEAPGLGPLAGLAAALRRSDGDAHLVAAADLPFLDPRVLLRLAGLLGEADAAVPRTERGPEPLHAASRRSALPAARALLDRGERRMDAFLAAVSVRWVGPEAWRDLDLEGRTFLNVNTPADLEAARGAQGSGVP